MVEDEQFELVVRENKSARSGYTGKILNMGRFGRVKMDIMQLVFVYNLLLMPFGIILLITGALTANNVHPYRGFLYGRYHTVAMSTIMAGLTDVMTAVFGCYGVLRDRSCMLWIYPHLLVFIFFFQVAIAGMSFLNQSGEILTSKLEENILNYEKYNTTVDTLQTQLQCCGFNNYTDFINITTPSSCCISHTCSFNEHYERGCKDALDRLIHMTSNIVGFISLTLAIIEIIGLVILCFYTQHLTSHRYQRQPLSTHDLMDDHNSEDEKSSVLEM